LNIPYSATSAGYSTQTAKQRGWLYSNFSEAMWCCWNRPLLLLASLVSLLIILR